MIIVPNLELIAVDIDELLAYTMQPIAEFANARYGTNLQREHIFDYSLSRVFGKSEEEVDELLDEFDKSEEIKNVGLVPGAKKGIEILARQYKLVAVTSREESTHQLTRNWLDKNFPDKFSALYMTNNRITKGERRSKADVCLKIGAGLLLEDALHHAKDCAQKGIPILLLDCPWNQTREQLPDRLTRVYSWTQIVRHIKQNY